ncbi:MAG: hypothetical protein WAW17_13610 [Rhodococcus sp. (in: high G+C Gram-positive bacteria)]|uniref:hypothetical protein n=1 Tax=Rhodococcus sp. TaxID=1831 RepID=UPI003BB18A0D
MDDSSLYDLPTEFFAGFAAAAGYCDAQSILPVDDRYVCHCSCGRWDLTAASRDEGLALARAHTQATSA